LWGGEEAFLSGGRRRTQGKPSSEGNVTRSDDQGNGRGSGGVVGRGPGEKSLPVRVHGPGEPGREIVGGLAQRGAYGEIVGEGGANVDPVFRPGAQDRSDPGGEIGGPEGAGSMEVLSPHDLASEIPFGLIVVERDLRAIEEESEPVPVPDETLHRFYGRGRKALVKVFFGLLLHEGEMRHKSIAVLDPVFRLFPETIELSDAADPGGDPGSHAGMLGEDSDEVSSDMGPAEGENESDDSGRSILVGGEAVGEEGAGPVGKVGKGNF